MFPKKGEQNQKWQPQPCLPGGPKEGGSATSSLRSRGPLQKGTEIKVAHKRAEVLRTPAFSGVPKQGDKVKGGAQVGGSAT